MNFDLQLKDEKVKPHQVTALHLIAALAMTGAGALFALNYPPSLAWSVLLTLAGLTLLFITVKWNKKVIEPANTLKLRVFEAIVLLALALFSTLHHWPPPAITFGVLFATVSFALFWEKGRRSMLVQVNDRGIKLPAGRTKRDISWPEIDKVLLRFGTLTVNCADNRLYQWSVDIANFDKESFHTFCDNHIKEGKTKRDLSDW